MPIRCTCPTCHQRLSVAQRKAGQEVQCPRCRRPVRVPEEGVSEPWQGTSGSAALATGTMTDPAASPLADGDELVLVASGEQFLEPADQAVVTVPRRVIYLQGVLLGLVALVFFVFGLMVGARSTSNPAQPAGTMCVVSGSVSYTDATGRVWPDAGSVVVLVPATLRPDEKASAEGLAPGEPFADHMAHPGLLIIRALGGDYARVDAQGRYRMRSVPAGRFFLLIVSAHARRSNQTELRAEDLAEMGRYFTPATHLVGPFRYRWQETELADDRRVDMRF